MNFLKSMKKVYDHIEEILLVILLAATVVILFYQIVMRYVFNNSPVWTEEVARYLFVWETWVGVSIGAKYGKHIEVTMIVDLFAEKGRAFFRILSDLIVIIICLVVVQQGSILVDKLLTIGSNSPALNIPMGYIYLSVPVGCGLMILRNIESICKAFGIIFRFSKVKGSEI